MGVGTQTPGVACGTSFQTWGATAVGATQVPVREPLFIAQGAQHQLPPAV